MFVSIFRVLKFAFQDFWRNIWLSIITITIIVLTLFTINFLIGFNVITDKAIKSVEDKIDVSVYFNSDVGETEAHSVESYLLSLPQVKDVLYISKEEALQSFKERHKNDPKIVESLKELDSNPLGTTLIIKAYKPADYPDIIKALDEAKYNKLISEKDFDDHKVIINRINSITDKVQTVTLGIIIFFSLVAILIVFNTIRIAIYTHREEIGIMKLVGASNWFIRSPFLIEGIIYSLIACAITFAFIYPVLNFIQPYISGFFQDSNFNLAYYFKNNFVKIFGWELLLVIVLNILSSYWAMRKYLKV